MSDPSQAEGSVVDVGPVAHGGHCVARLDGKVVFVRHALPGERVRLRLTDERGRFLRADAVEVVEPSPDRIDPVCPIAGPGGCGGCDFQHATPEAQRRLKTSVVAELLDRFAGISWRGAVEDVPPTLGWRTRMRYATTPDGRLGMRAHRSSDVLALPEQGCAIAALGARPELTGHDPDSEVVAVSADRDLAGPGAVLARETVAEEAAGRRFEVNATGFWQVHPQAADVLVDAVLEGLDPQAGESAFDLYCGVGLFAGALVDAGVRVHGVEASRDAIAAARRNVPQARFSAARVEKALATLPRQTDRVVLDPPRAGAGRAVVDQVARRRPRAVAYVACDPAALARDLATFADRGYTVSSLRAFDLFPMTQHVECVAILVPAVDRDTAD